VWLSLLLLCAAACGHAPSSDSSRSLTRHALNHEFGWLAIDSVPLYQQEGSDNGGPTALAMVLAYWHPAWPQPRSLLATSAPSMSPESLRDRALAYGLDAALVAGTLDDIRDELGSGRPLIANLVKRSVVEVERYEVIIGLHRRTLRVATLDPAAGLRQRSIESFLREWDPAGRRLLVVSPQRAQFALK
jgi:Papain-like cysteine protease AvrRpt2